MNDVKADAGEIISTVGGQVDIVERTPPFPRRINGRPEPMAWVAPYSANCKAHGWIVSRATVDQASESAREHAAADEAKGDRAYRLGSIDAYAGRSMRDMYDGDSAWLMTELGETSDTTDANIEYRGWLCERYEDGYCTANSALRV